MTGPVDVSARACFGVFTGAAVSALTRVGPALNEFGRVRVDAVAGQSYWIAVGSSDLPNFTPFTLSVTPA